MNLLKPEEGLPLAPSICFICEQSPFRGAIDTGRTHDPQVPTNLRGRKYVCVDCAEEFGKFIGMEDAKTAATLRERIEEQNAFCAEQALRIEQLEAVHVEMLRDLLAKATKPTSVAMPPAPAVRKKAPTTEPNGG